MHFNLYYITRRFGYLFKYLFICMFECIKIRVMAIHPNVEVNAVLYHHTLVYLLVIAFHSLINLYIYIIFVLK